MPYISLHTKLRRGNFTLSGNCEITSRTTGVFGPSGAGKTSLLHLLAGLQKPDEGKLQINDEVFFDSQQKIFVPAHKRRVGYVFQEGRTFPHLSVEANLKYGWKKNTHHQQYFNEIVDLLELNPLLKKRPGQLSGGQNQRVAIGRALMANVQLLLLDEPFSSLDPVIKKQAISLINKVIHHLKIPVIIVSHELKDLLMITQNLLLIKDGQLEPPGSYLELIRRNKLPEFDGLIENYYNVFTGHVSEIFIDKGISKVSLEQAENLTLSIESDEFKFHPGGPVKVLLRGSDIAISLSHIKDISIRNQFPGKIVSVTRQHNHLVCIIDCGIHLIARLTIDAGKTLGLEPGKKVWCLFKSLAVEAYK